MFVAVPTARAAAETPPDRDRVVDAARAVALLVVVAGHAIMAVVAWPDGIPVLGNLLAAYPWTQALTWVLQIMPLFFFAGGAANALSWDRHRARGGDYASWLWARAAGCCGPPGSTSRSWRSIAAVVTVLAPAAHGAEPLMMLTTQLLWFLGAYLLVTALDPAVPAPRRRGARRASRARCCCSASSRSSTPPASPWGCPDAIGLLNFVLVWAVPAYLGSLRAHGTLAALPRAGAGRGRPRRRSR